MIIFSLLIGFCQLIMDSGKAFQTGASQKTCQTTKFVAFGWKSEDMNRYFRSIFTMPDVAND
jgi:hypothetical protein